MLVFIIDDSKHAKNLCKATNAKLHCATGLMYPVTYVALLSDIYKCVSSVSNNLNSVPPPDGGIGTEVEEYATQQYHGFQESQCYESPKKFAFPAAPAKIGKR